VIVKEDLLIGMSRYLGFSCQFFGSSPVQEGNLISRLKSERLVEIANGHLQIANAQPVGVKPSEHSVDDRLVIQNRQGLVSALQSQRLDIFVTAGSYQRNVVTQQSDEEPWFRHGLGKRILNLMDEPLPQGGWH